MRTTTPLVMDFDHQPQLPSPDDCDSESHSDDELCLVLTPRIPAPAAVVLPPVQEHPPRAQTPPPALDVASPVVPPAPQPLDVWQKRTIERYDNRTTSSIARE